MGSSSCGSYAAQELSSKQCDAVAVTRNVAALLSLAGCTFVLAMIILHKTYRNNWAQRIVLWMTVAAFLQPIPYLAPTSHEANTACVAQGFFVSLFNWALLLWVCSILHAVYWAVIKQKSTERYEKHYHVVCWGISFVFAIIPVLAGAYGPGGSWCWIDKSHTWLRFLLWYVPLFFTIFGLMAGTAHVLAKVRRKTRTWSGMYNPQVEKEKQWMNDQVNPVKFYPVLYFFVAICPLINRIQNAAAPGHPVFELYLLQAVFSPAQGLFNAVYYTAMTDRVVWQQCTLTGIRRSLMTRNTQISEFQMGGEDMTTRMLDGEDGEDGDGSDEDVIFEA